jgi:hypothetical protein
VKEREGRIASKIEFRNLVVFSILRESKCSERGICLTQVTPTGCGLALGSG